MYSDIIPVIITARLDQGFTPLRGSEADKNARAHAQVRHTDRPIRTIPTVNRGMADGVRGEAVHRPALISG